MSIKTKTKLKDTCHPFYMFLHGKPENGALRLSTGLARSLKSEWEVALSNITYNQMNDFEIVGDEMQMVMAAPSQYSSEYHIVKSWMSKHLKFDAEYAPDHFTKFSNACLVTMCKDGTPIKSPTGRFSLTEWIDEVNALIANSEFFAGPGVKIWRENDENIIQWHYHKSNVMKVFFFPIFNEAARYVLGMPDPITPAFKTIINKMVDNKNTVLTESAVTLKRTPLLIECNLCEHNGLATLHHTCATSTEGHVLRIISQNPDMEFGKPQTVEFKQLQFVPLRASGFTEVKVRILNADSLSPACFDGVVNIGMYFRPRDASCSTSDRETHPRSFRSSVEHTTMDLSDTWEQLKLTVIPDHHFIDRPK